MDWKPARIAWSVGAAAAALLAACGSSHRSTAVDRDFAARSAPICQQMPTLAGISGAVFLPLPAPRDQAPDRVRRVVAALERVPVAAGRDGPAARAFLSAVTGLETQVGRVADAQDALRRQKPANGMAVGAAMTHAHRERRHLAGAYLRVAAAPRSHGRT